jgi:hypothetical protein
MDVRSKTFAASVCGVALNDGATGVLARPEECPRRPGGDARRSIERPGAPSKDEKLIKGHASATPHHSAGIIAQHPHTLLLHIVRVFTP